MWFMENELNFLWGNLRKDNLSAFTVIAILQVESVLYSILRVSMFTGHASRKHAFIILTPLEPHFYM